MKLLRSAFRLLNSNKTERFFPAKRFFNESTIDSNKPKFNTQQSVEQTPQEEIYDRPMFNAQLVENELADGITLSAYNTFGFRLNGRVQVIGPIIVFPRTVFSWHIESFERIDSDSLMMFGLIQPRIETLIIGAGDYETSTSHIGKNILEIAHKHRINVEVLTTELACMQFNYLRSEGRMTAAALIPPKDTRMGDDDAFQSLCFDNKLFTVDNAHS